MLWKVYYKISGYTKEFSAGPYEDSDIQYQMNDIAGYEGVYDVRKEQYIDELEWNK